MNPMIDRRMFFKIGATGVAGYFVSPLETFAQISTTTGPATILSTAKNCIFILLPGAPSQTDTFDLHVGQWTPANFDPQTINGIDWPSGLMPGQNRFAIDSLTTMTGSVSPRSASVKVRTARSGVPIASK